MKYDSIFWWFMFKDLLYRSFLKTKTALEEMTKDELREKYIEVFGGLDELYINDRDYIFHRIMSSHFDQYHNLLRSMNTEELKTAYKEIVGEDPEAKFSKQFCGG